MTKAWRAYKAYISCLKGTSKMAYLAIFPYISLSTPFFMLGSFEMYHIETPKTVHFLPLI